MSNHYHLVFRTPEPNLVEGMSWFQKTFTQRINASNRLRGHLFAERYKAILVENPDFTGSRYLSDYLSTLINYVHLNPGRAGLVDGAEKPILNYQWSSLSQWYAVAPSKRPEGAQVTEGLEMLRYKDTVAGRRNYVKAEQTTLSQTRIAEILNMRTAGNVSQQIFRFRKTEPTDHGKKISAFIKKSRLITWPLT